MYVKGKGTVSNYNVLLYYWYSTRGGRAIAKNAIKTMGFKNYFRNMAISHVDNSTEDKMESLTQQTSTLNLSTSMLKVCYMGVVCL